MSYSSYSDISRRLAQFRSLYGKRGAKAREAIHNEAVLKSAPRYARLPERPKQVIMQRPMRSERHHGWYAKTVHIPGRGPAHVLLCDHMVSGNRWLRQRLLQKRRAALLAWAEMQEKKRAA